MKNGEKSHESFLTKWIHEKNEASPTSKMDRSPKHSIMSFETDNSSDLFSEKFSFAQKRSKTASKFFMRVNTDTIMTSPLQKKLSNFESLDENNEESAPMNINSFNTQEVSRKRARAGTYSKLTKNLEEEVEDENVRILFIFIKNPFFF